MTRLSTFRRLCAATYTQMHAMEWSFTADSLRWFPGNKGFDTIMIAFEGVN